MVSTDLTLYFTNDLEVDFDRSIQNANSYICTDKNFIKPRLNPSKFDFIFIGKLILILPKPTIILPTPTLVL